MPFHPSKLPLKPSLSSPSFVPSFLYHLCSVNLSPSPTDISDILSLSHPCAPPSITSPFYTCLIPNFYCIPFSPTYHLFFICFSLSSLLFCLLLFVFFFGFNLSWNHNHNNRITTNNNRTSCQPMMAAVVKVILCAGKAAPGGLPPLNK